MRISSIVPGACGIVLLMAGLASAADLSKADQQFMTTAARIDMTEAHEGQMAEQQASRSDVKEFAKTLVDDHTKSYDDLSALASKAGASIPNGINTAKDRTIVGLVHLKGASFDRTFSRDEVAACRREIAMYKREADHGQDADVKAYASKMVPVLQKELQQAEAAEKPAGRS